MSKLSKRAISTLVITVLLLSTIAAILPMAAADPLTGVTATPTLTASGESTTYTIDFTTATTGDIATVDMAFPAGFGVSGATLVSTGLGAGTISVSAQVVTYTVTAPASIPLSTGITITLGTIVNTETPGTLYTVSVTTNTAGPVVLDGPTDSDPFTIVQAQGTLTIVTDPVGGEMFVDGGSVGTGPYTGVSWDVGTYTVSFGPVLDYATPASQEAVITYNTLTEILGTYVLITSEFSIDSVSDTVVDYDEVLTVTGSGVTAGSVVTVFWDYAGGINVHPLNSTEGNPDGTFDCEVTVPSDVVGGHFLWAKDIATGQTVPFGPITMVPKITMSPSSGLVGDEITIKGYGFSDESDVTFTFDGDELDTVPATVETDENGYFKCTFDVPAETIYGPYTVVALDDTGESDSDTFTVGASISLDTEEGPSGKVVTITGIGWTPLDTVTLTIDGEDIFKVGKTAINVGSTGKFSAKIVIPSMSKGEYTITAIESDIIPPAGVKGPATAKFEVTGETVIKLTPGYGPPGGSVEINGYNFTQISGTVIELTLDGGEVSCDIETDSKGEFSGTIRIPAVAYGIHPLTASDAYALSDQHDFRIGIMIVIISPSYGPTGTPIYLTGIGFSEGKTWNATMDGVAITDEAMDIESGSETISETIYIPTIPEGTYTITVLDIDTEIEVSATFVVTAVTELSMDPASAPNEYNVTVTGLNFAGKIEPLTFVLYNATEEWDMNVIQTIGGTEYPAETDVDGEFTAWWLVPDDEVLSIGSYTVNVTDGKGLFTQTSFSIVKERIYIKPLKDKFDIGDTVSFDIKNDFYYDDSFMEIRDTDNSLYWRTQPFDKDVDWLKDAGLYTVPFYAQVSGGNPMTLSSDAPLGEWFWAFYIDADDQLVNGTFVVGPSLEAALTEQIQALSEELGIDIDTLRTYIDDLGIDMDESVSSMAEQIATAVSGMEDDISGLSEDLDDAVTGMQDDIDDMGTKMDSIETMVDDITGTSTAAQEAANEAAASADRALEAAEANQRQTGGLTGLVYGAIAASLIAALAAIVSLMQISRRIAG